MSHAGAAPATGLSASITSSQTSFNVLSGTGYPSGAGGPFVIVIDQGTSTEEKVLISSLSGTTMTVASGGRGWDSTTAASHNSGATNVEHVFSANEADDANAHIYTPSRNDHTQYVLYSGVTGAGGISVSGSGTAMTITGSGSGVSSITGGTGITASPSTGAVTVTNAGVTSLTAGSGISLTGSTGSVTITNTGGSGAPGTTVESYIGTDANLPQNSATNITNVSLAAGTWLITARASIVLSTAGGGILFDLWIGPTSGSATSAYAAAQGPIYGESAEPAYATLQKSVTLGSTTTVYLIAQTNAAATNTIKAASWIASIPNVSGITAVRTA